MHTRLPRPSAALIISCLSLFVALGGVGYAAATGSIDSRELKNNSVVSKDIKNNSLIGKDVKTSSLTGSDVKDGSLTGSDVVESGLTKVPSAGQADSAVSAQNATNAGNAATVGGLRVIPFVYRSDETEVATVAAEVGGLRVELSCGGGDTDLRLVNISGAPAEVNYGATLVAEDQTSADVNKALGNNLNVEVTPLGFPDDGSIGQASFVTQAGRSVRVQYTANQGVFGFDCSTSGVVIG